MRLQIREMTRAVRLCGLLLLVLFGSSGGLHAGVPQSAAAGGEAQDRAARLAEARRLTDAGEYRQAMDVYRQVFGDTPPLQWALAYYETEAATAAGRPHAVAGLRALVAQYPGQMQYQVALGKVLTYDPKTRDEGQRYLQRFPQDVSAVKALGQSLLWDSANPATAPKIRSFLAIHPDPALAHAVERLDASSVPPERTTPGQQYMAPPRAELRPVRPLNAAAGGSASSAGPARSKPWLKAETSAGYRALKLNHVSEAATRFAAVLAADPANAQAEAGMGYVRVAQGDDAGALSYLEQARRATPGDRTLESALKDAQFRANLTAARAALRSGDVEAAERQFRAAMGVRPESLEAAAGLGATLLFEQSPAAAVPFYQRLVQGAPGETEGWRGLLIARAEAGDANAALAGDAQAPAAVRMQLMRDPGYLVALARAYSETGREDDAERTLAIGLDLPFPPAARSVTPEDEEEYAAVLLAAGRPEQAAGLYRLAVAARPTDVAAQQGQVEAEAASGRDAEALQQVEQMSGKARAMAMRDAEFVAAVAAAYAGSGKLQQAQELLDRVEAERAAEGLQASPVLELASAGLFLQTGNAPQALLLYRREAAQNARNAEAWAGLIAALHADAQDQQALAEVPRIPAEVRLHLEQDSGFCELLAQVDAAQGRWREGAAELQQVEASESGIGVPVPVRIQLGSASLLLRAGEDPGTYRELTALGQRDDLSAEQETAVENLWAALAVRRAQQAAGDGEQRRAVTILNAAAEAFTANAEAKKTVAGGYVRTGRAAQALTIFKSVGPASASEYEDAVEAALIVGDHRDAQLWARAALKAYPADPAVLLLAAKVEQGRGESRQAIAYYKASLKALGAEGPGGMGSMQGEARGGAAGSTSAAEGRRRLAALLAPATGGAAEALDKMTPAGKPAFVPYAGQTRSMPSSSGGGRLRDYTPPAPAVQPVGQGSATARDPAAEIMGRYTPSFGARGGSGLLQRVSFGPQSGAPQVPQPGRYSGQMGGEPGGVSDTGQQQYSQPAATAKTAHGASTSAPARAAARPNETARPAQQGEPYPSAPVAPIAPVHVPLSTPADAGPLLQSTPGAGLPRQSAPGLRGQAQSGLISLEGSYSGWLGAEGAGRLRSGQPGFDRLYDVEAPSELSLAAGHALRLTAIARPVYLSSGTLRSTSFAAGTAPYLGTVSLNTISAPVEQFSSGLGGELQLSTKNVGIAAGYTPYEFAAPNITGRFNWTLGRHVAVFGERQPVKDSLLSYAGLYDAGQASPGLHGPIWGGVVSETGGIGLQFAGDGTAFSASAQGGVVRGHHVLLNNTASGVMDASFRIHRWGGVGSLAAGAALRGMHYEYNESGLTYGQGGYFSPRQYVAAMAPVRFAGYHGSGFHYEITAGTGVLTYEQDWAPFYPLDPGLQSGFVPVSGVACTADEQLAHTCGAYPAISNTGLVYDVRGRVAYLAGEHWYFGAYVSANNLYQYDDVTAGIGFRYVFLRQREVDGYPTGLFPLDGLRPLQIP